MGLSIGLIEGTDVEQLIGIRPGDTAHEADAGVVFHPQDEGGGSNVAHYEIAATDDKIEFNINQYIFPMEDPTLVLYTAWGETDFTLIERGSGEEVVAEQSGFDTDHWFADVSAVEGDLRITNFNTGDGVDGTQAAFLPYVGIFDAVV